MEVEDIITNNDNKEEMLKAVKENGKNLDLVSERLQDDDEIDKYLKYLNEIKSNDDKKYNSGFVNL